MRVLKLIFIGALLVGLTALSVFSQNQVDLTFNAAPSLAADNSANTKGQVVQADGKVVVWGGSLNEGSLIKGLVARLNADGSLDPTFNFCGCSFSSVTSVVIEADGKMLVAGSNTFNRGKVIRVTSAGGFDTSYSSPFTGAVGSPGNSARIRVLQADGKAIIESIFFGFAPANNYLARYNTTGLVDNSFSQIVLGGNNTVGVPDVVVSTDGKIYFSITSIIGSHSTVSLKRFNADGTEDGTWNAPGFTEQFGFATLDALDVQADGSVVVGGRFNAVNGVTRNGFVRVFSAGNVDLNFSVTGFVSVSQIKVLSSGKILISASNAPGNLNKIYRLNSDGSIDNSLVKPAFAAEKSKALDAEKLVGDNGPIRNADFVQVASTAVLNRFSLDAQENVVFFGQDQSIQQFYRLNSSGTFDSSFDASLSEFGKISFMLRQPDGKVVIYGTFISVNGIAKSKFARLNSDGSLDPTFDAGTAFDTDPIFMLVQPDGKILVSGAFSSYNGTPVSKLVRINSDGSLDGGFTHHVLIGINTLTLQPDGKILVGGSGVVRLNSDGSTDGSFSPIFGNNSGVRSIVLQSDGKVLVGGFFVGVNGFNRMHLVRLNTDASLDQSYNPSVMNGPGVSSIWLQPDGKLLVCETSSSQIFMKRMNTDSSADASFTPVTFQFPGTGGAFIKSVVFRSNGEILAGGNFTSVGQSTTANFAWLNPSGKVHPLIFPEGVNGTVHGLAMQPDGKLLMGGEFTHIDNTPRAGVARVSLALFHGAPQFDFDGDGRADISIFRPSDGNWYLANSATGFSITHWGQAGDKVTVADYDGDGRADLGVYRTGAWFYIKSATNTIGLANWGAPNDIPLPSDFDGDGKAEFTVYHPATGQWLRNGSGGITSIIFGLPTDIPLIADFDGDGKADPTVFRPSDGVIWYASTVDGLFYAHPWGKPGDIPVLADYDGDGKTDPAVFRPATRTWYIMNSHDGSITTKEWGFSDDRPTPADYDGDGRADIAIYRPSNGMWFIYQSTGGPAGMQFGLSSDQAVPNAYIP